MDNKHTQELSKIDLILDTVLHRGRTSLVYRCHTKENKKLLVCVKAKSISQTENYEKEARLLEKLKGIAPSLHFVHRVGDDEFIAMHYMGLSLHDLFEESGRKFSSKTLALIGLRTLVLLEALHNEGYIHGRLTPKKILTDRDPNKTQLYLVGLSDVKKFKTEKGEHIRYKESEIPNKTGSEFASLNYHAGIRLSRRDDIESLIYILLHFETRGEIFDQKSKSWEYKDLYKWKLETPAELMHPKVSIELVQLLNYAKGLKFEERPNYEKIHKLFKNLLLKDIGKQHPDQVRFDWCTNKSDNNASVPQVTDKRKVLHGLLQGEKVNRFPTILEDPCEYLETKEAEQFDNDVLVAEDGEFTFSPSYKPSYNSLQLTPKLDSQQQPALRSRMKPIESSDPSNVQSPWNCSETGDELATVIDKVKSLEFVTTLRLS